jgi:hypothetical protein
VGSPNRDSHFPHCFVDGASLLDIPGILMAAAAFFAIYKKISLPYILVAGGTLSILIYGFLF